MRAQAGYSNSDYLKGFHASESITSLILWHIESLVVDLRHLSLSTDIFHYKISEKPKQNAYDIEGTSILLHLCLQQPAGHILGAYPHITDSLFCRHSLIHLIL